MSQPTRILLWGQIILALSLMFCFALRPQFLRNEGGFSNYGVTPITIVPFTIAFLAAAVSAALAAQRLRQPFAGALETLAVLWFMVLVSTYPYKLNNTFDVIHQLAGLVILAYGVALSVWVFTAAARRGHDRSVYSPDNGSNCCRGDRFGFRAFIIREPICRGRFLWRYVGIGFAVVWYTS